MGNRKVVWELGLTFTGQSRPPDWPFLFRDSHELDTTQEGFAKSSAVGIVDLALKPSFGVSGVKDSFSVVGVRREVAPLNDNQWLRRIGWVPIKCALCVSHANLILVGYNGKCQVRQSKAISVAYGEDVTGQ